MGLCREVVITGGGTGIGYAVAAAFAGLGERIVTIGSIAARTGAGSYGAALEAWNVDVAREFGPCGITTDIVAPGQVVHVNGGAYLGR